MRAVHAVSIAAAAATALDAGAALAEAPAPQRPCEVTFSRAPDEVRRVIEHWVHAEPRCATSLDLRVIPTEGGLYLFAREASGRIHERVVPDAQSAGVLVASWIADDSVGPAAPSRPPAAAPAGGPPAVVGGATAVAPVSGSIAAAPGAPAPVGGSTAAVPGAPAPTVAPGSPVGGYPPVAPGVPVGGSPAIAPAAPVGGAPAIAPAAPVGGAAMAPAMGGPGLLPPAELGAVGAVQKPSRSRWLSVGFTAVPEGESTGVRAELDVLRRGSLTLGLAAAATNGHTDVEAAELDDVATLDFRALATLGRAFRSGPWQVRLYGGLGIAFTRMEGFQMGAFRTGQGVFAAAEGGVTIGRDLGARWGIDAGPMLTWYGQNVSPEGGDAQMREVETTLFAGLRRRL